MAREPGERDVRSLVIGVLGRREAYGYEVAAQLRGVTEGSNLAEGSVYPVLRRLERDGLASGHWVEIGTEVPRRRYYVLTPKGLAVHARGEAGSSATSTRRLGELRP
jgi:DNA-binding PadR family transcriptional regulator